MVEEMERKKRVEREEAIACLPCLIIQGTPKGQASPLEGYYPGLMGNVFFTDA